MSERSKLGFEGFETALSLEAEIASIVRSLLELAFIQGK
jgi:hypothetical protein